MRSLILFSSLALQAALAWAQVPAAASPAAPVSDRSRTDEVEVRLISASSRVQPGQTVLLALEQRIAPHWHTYWRNPGDSGQPTSIEWTLPAGAQAGQILWPAPRRFDVGPITNYGYEDQALLLTELKLPQDLPLDRPVTLKADATWLVCREECIPQQATLMLQLPVAAQSAAGDQSARLNEARARLPKPAPFQVQSRLDGTELQLTWPAQTSERGKATTEALFMPQDWGRIQHAAKAVLDRQGDEWRLRMPVGEQPAKVGDTLEGLLLVDGQAWQVSSPLGGSAAPKADGATGANAGVVADPALGGADNLSLWTALLLALAGGLVLNLMPCVFPVLAIKALGFLHGHAGEHRRQGLAYTAGVLVAFAALAGVLIAVRSAGGSVGWGFQFHSPLFVMLLAWLMFLMGLSLAGALQIGAGLAGVGQGLASRPGLTGSFFTGVLATVVATPCTAPFMGAAMAYALAQPPLPLLAVFLALGLGLALPYLALAWWPSLQRMMPRPGAWMDVLKQGLAFPMFGAAIWLVWVLAQQAGPQGVLLALVGMGLMALAAWLRTISRFAGPRGRWTGALTAAASVAAALALLPLLSSESTDSVGAQAKAGADYEPYSPERLTELRAQGKPVFVNLTASWCITCLVNEKVALSTPEVRQAFQNTGVTYLKGDWTRQDPRITELLSRHGRSGVPLYLYYPAGTGDNAQVLPQILTPGIVTSALQGNAT
ncbi:protein-disulfide reductase DsbD family protein [Roseateles amylovorans]|uniref:Protein-disulfide reductase DsbD family protein n=1 Tax=Roseateles amylovorans TaxID=2978473 RepID=A0ABY6B386_9BURK|nr:protein-disulfide reductase DsbD domain-containing protein [Roseateles amylovorans]UXH78439.1 protein-disulfide reductase DsbD family protein [Roseateles amylovorans]